MGLMVVQLVCIQEKAISDVGFTYQIVPFLIVHKSFMNAASKAVERNCICDGVKSVSGLANLVDGVSIDYIMHCVLEGVTKRLLEAWVKSF